MPASETRSFTDLLVKTSTLTTPVNKIVINIGPETQVNGAALRDTVLKKANIKHHNCTPRTMIIIS